MERSAAHLHPTGIQSFDQISGLFFYQEAGARRVVTSSDITHADVEALDWTIQTPDSAYDDSLHPASPTYYIPPSGGGGGAGSTSGSGSSGGSSGGGTGGGGSTGGAGGTGGGTGGGGGGTGGGTGSGGTGGGGGGGGGLGSGGGSGPSGRRARGKARWRNQPLTLKEVHESYLTARADNSEGPVQWEDGEEEDDKTTGWRLLDTYLRESHVPAEVKPDAVEVPVEADLGQHGLPKLIGILDLVQQKQIVDYKTTSTTPNAEKVAHSNEIQTSSYALLYRHNTGGTEAGVQLHHLVKLKNTKVVMIG